VAGEITEVEIVVKSTDLGSDQYVRGEVYFTYFEQSRLEHLRRLAIVPVFPPPPDAPNYFAIAETTARYRGSARFGDCLRVRTRTGEVRNRSFTLVFEIRRQTGDELLTEGQSVQVWLDADRQPAAIPEPARTRLEESIPPPG
jgi:YbgC/YbaW family acyl-CoA thioester hydrolase